VTKSLTAASTMAIQIPETHLLTFLSSCIRCAAKGQVIPFLCPWHWSIDARALWQKDITLECHMDKSRRGE